MIERPHIEFIQAQLLPWRRIGPGNARPDAEFKFLSRDAVDGASSAIIRYPPGWRRACDETIGAAEEFYVLAGEIEINGRAFPFDSYGYFPAHASRRTMSTGAGAAVLTFFDREPMLEAGNGDPRADLGVVACDALHMPWDMSLNDPKLAHLRISRKNLREDPETGERTFLSMMFPHSEPPGRRGPREIHPVVEEAYVISGSLTGPHGAMAPGAYFWRPAGVAHGPFGTRWGCVALIRFLGGRHVNVWTSEEAPFDFDAPYAPILPDEFSAYAFAPWTPPPRY